MKKELNPGKYYIGDPCYLFDKSWLSILKETNHFKKSKLIDTTDFFIHNTQWGDGGYQGSDNFIYCVSSGLLGILPFHLINIDNKLDLKDTFFRIITFEKKFECSYNKGVFLFDNIKIKT